MSFFQRLRRNLQVLRYFMFRELLVLRKGYLDNLINMLIWPITGGLVNGYVMPALGLSTQYAGFFFVGSVVILAFYICFEEATALIYDIEGDRRISYELSLPYSPNTILFKYGLAYAVRMVCMTIFLPFLGKLILYDRFTFAHLSFGKFVFAYVLACLLFSFFALHVCAYINTQNLLNIRMRVIDPIGFLGGCVMFSWATLYSIWPLMARIIFFNPVAHATESVRASFLGQQGYINYWVSCTFLMVYIVLFFYLSVWALRRRLDYVSFKYVPTHTK